jgi:hypothetical protein
MKSVFRLAARQTGGGSFAASGGILQGEFVGRHPTRDLAAAVYQTVKATLVLLWSAIKTRATHEPKARRGDVTAVTPLGYLDEPLPFDR